MLPEKYIDFYTERERGDQHHRPFLITEDMAILESTGVILEWELKNLSYKRQCGSEKSLDAIVDTVPGPHRLFSTAIPAPQQLFPGSDRVRNPFLPSLFSGSTVSAALCPARIFWFPAMTMPMKQI